MVNSEQCKSTFLTESPYWNRCAHGQESNGQESKKCLELIKKTKPKQPKAALAVIPWCIFILITMCRWDASVAQCLPSVSANRYFGVMLIYINFGSQTPKEAGERRGEILMLLPIACPEILPCSARAGRSRVVRRRLRTALCHSKGEVRAQVKGSRMAGFQVTGPWHDSLGQKHSVALHWPFSCAFISKAAQHVWWRCQKLLRNSQWN